MIDARDQPAIFLEFCTADAVQGAPETHEQSLASPCGDLFHQPASANCSYLFARDLISPVEQQSFGHCRQAATPEVVSGQRSAVTDQEELGLFDLSPIGQQGWLE